MISGSCDRFALAAGLAHERDRRDDQADGKERDFFPPCLALGEKVVDEQQARPGNVTAVDLDNADATKSPKQMP